MKKILVAALFLMLGSPALAGGQAAPFTLSSLNDPGTTVSLADFAGKVVYVDFWAAWCGPCRDAVPFLDGLQAKYGEDGFQVIGVGIDTDIDDANRFMGKFPVSYPMLWDRKSQTLGAYGVEIMPTGFLIDRDGRIVFTHIGFKDKDKAHLEAEVAKLLGR